MLTDLHPELIQHITYHIIQNHHPSEIQDVLMRRHQRTPFITCCTVNDKYRLQCIIKLIITCKLMHAIYSESTANAFWNAIVKELNKRYVMKQPSVPGVAIPTSRFIALIASKHCQICRRQIWTAPVRWQFNCRMCRHCMLQNTINRITIRNQKPHLMQYLAHLPSERLFYQDNTINRNRPLHTRVYLLEDIQRIESLSTLYTNSSPETAGFGQDSITHRRHTHRPNPKRVNKLSP